MGDNMLIELCASSLHDALLAEKYNINRIELNSALELGGLSPSLSVVEKIKQNIGVKLIAMLRVRPGGFVYDNDEMILMLNMASDLLSAGADGLAFGALKNDFSIDIDSCKKVLNITKKYKAEFVFHRAFDMQNNINAVQTLIDIGTDRLLTSGMMPNAWLGRDNIKLMQERYGSNIEILVGSGVNTDNVIDIAEYTGVSQLHGSFSEIVLQSSQNDVNFSNYMQASESKLQKLEKIIKNKANLNI